MRKANVAKVILLVLVTVALVAMSLLGACAKEAPAPAPAPAPKPVEPITLKVVTFNPPNNARTMALLDWMAAAQERSKGELIFDYLGGVDVIGYKEQPMAVRNGVVDISMLGGSALKGTIPEMRLLAMSRIPIEEEMKGGAWDIIQERAKTVGIYFIGRMDTKTDWPNFYLHLMKEVRTFDDLKGIRAAGAGTYADAAAKELGMSYAIIKMGDAYGAMDRGLIDTYIYSIDASINLGFHEINPYILDEPFYRSNTNIIMNLDRWNSLPEHLKKLMTDTYAEFVPHFATKCSEGVLNGRKVTKEAGVEFIKFSEADAKKYYDIAYGAQSKLYIEEMPETGPAFLKMVKAIE